MFASPELAARIDRAEGRLVADIARLCSEKWPSDGSQVFAVAGGAAVYAGPSSPANKMIGIGYDALPDEGELEHIERAFAARQASLQAEVSTLAHPGLPALLVRRGYEPRGFENVLAHPLTATEAGAPAGITIALVTGADRAAWMEAILSAFTQPDAGGVGGDVIPPSGELRKWFLLTTEIRGFDGFVARAEAEIAGGGSLRLDGGIAQLCGAATLPAFRRRGVQTALLRHRLRHARGAGCDMATVVTQPASKSQQNVQREGFHLLYSRQLLVKP